MMDEMFSDGPFLVNSALGGDAAAPVNIDAGPDGVLNCISMPLSTLHHSCPRGMPLNLQFLERLPQSYFSQFLGLHMPEGSFDEAFPAGDFLSWLPSQANSRATLHAYICLVSTIPLQLRQRKHFRLQWMGGGMVTRNGLLDLLGRHDLCSSAEGFGAGQHPCHPTSGLTGFDFGHDVDVHEPFWSSCFRAVDSSPTRP